MRVFQKSYQKFIVFKQDLQRPLDINFGVPSVTQIWFLRTPHTIDKSIQYENILYSQVHMENDISLLVHQVNRETESNPPKNQKETHRIWVAWLVI